MTREDLEAVIIQLAPAIDECLNPSLADGGGRRVGFLLCAFELGEPGTPLAYIANAQRDGLVAALRELIEKLDKTSRIVSLERPS